MVKIKLRGMAQTGKKPHEITSIPITNINGNIAIATDGVSITIKNQKLTLELLKFFTKYKLEKMSEEFGFPKGETDEKT